MGVLIHGLLNRRTSQYDWGITTGGLTFNLNNKVGRGGYARLALRTRGLGTRVPRSNPGAATFAFAKLRKRFRRPHPQV